MQNLLLAHTDLDAMMQLGLSKSQNFIGVSGDSQQATKARQDWWTRIPTLDRAAHQDHVAHAVIRAEP